MNEMGLKVIYDSQITTTSTGGPFQPGEVVVWRGGTNRSQSALAKWVLLDNNGCSQGEALVTDVGQTVEHGVKAAGTADEGGPCRGIAAATIASNRYGFSIMSGYCEKADLSHTAASGEYLMVSGSNAGKLTPNRASTFNTQQGTTTGSLFVVVARARTAISTGIGSVQVLSLWH